MAFPTFALILLLAPSIVGGTDEAEDRVRILRGVLVLERLGVPGTVAVFGDAAFPVLTCGDPPLPVVGAARHGKGRVLAVAHGAYLQAGALEDKLPGAAAFFMNALHWAAAKEGTLVVGLLGQDARLAEALGRLGHEVHSNLSPRSPGRCDVLIWKDAGPGDPAGAEALRAHLAAGGGLLTAVCPWGYEQVNAARGLTLAHDLPENQVLAPLGLAFAGGYAEATGPGGFAVDASRPAEAHAGQALAALDSGRPASLEVVEHAAQAVPLTEASFLTALRRFVKAASEEAGPRPDHPVDARSPAARLRVVLATRALREGSSTSSLVPSKGVSFPGEVPAEAVPVVRRLVLDPELPGWHSTGLYLPPSGRLEVHRLAGTSAGWAIRIGCHTDHLWGSPRWRRWPEITTRRPLARTPAVEWPFGGLIYFEAGKGAGPLEVEVRGAVEAPFFDLLDPASRERWPALRQAPAPWAEIAGRHLIFSLPSAAVRDLEDPTAILEWWDGVLRSHAALDGVPLSRRRERMVADVQISAGYMHSGYPIMTHLDVAAAPAPGQPAPVLDLKKLQREGNWGLFHEFGHNRQERAWNFSGTGEVTCNLYSLFTMERMSGLAPWTHPWLAAQKPAALTYLQNGANLEEWRRHPGIGLVTYAWVQRHFGWQPFQSILRQYATLRPEEEPRGDQERIDQWVLRLSRAVERDLRPYFRWWGLPLGEAVASDTGLATLPPWKPDLAELER